MNAPAALNEKKTQKQATRASARATSSAAARATEAATFALSTSDALSMRVELNDPATQSTDSNATLSVTPTHVVRMSRDELRFDHSDSLEPSQRIWVQMRLGGVIPGQSVNKKEIVVTCAEVISSDSKKDHSGKNCYDTRIRFVDCDQRVKLMVQQHIEGVIEKLCKNCREYTYVPGSLSNTAA